MIDERNKRAINIKTKYMSIFVLEKQNIIIFIVKQILLPCWNIYRVRYEAMMNNIKIISTNHRNLKYLLNDYAIFLNDIIQDWMFEIEKMYCNTIIDLNTNKNNLDNNLINISKILKLWLIKK